MRTRGGEFTADNVILANNAFARRLGFLRSRLVTIFTYAGVTPVLSPAQQALLGERDQWGVIPANRLGTTLRRISGGRFMVRSAYSYEAEQPLERMEQLLRDSFVRRYPDLAAHDFEYVWSGSTGLTGNGASFVGAIQPGLYASVGCNGAGVIKGTIYGKLLGEQVAGHRSAMLDDLASFEKPNWLPPRAAAPHRRAEHDRLPGPQGRAGKVTCRGGRYRPGRLAFMAWRSVPVPAGTGTPCRGCQFPFGAGTPRRGVRTASCPRCGRAAGAAGGASLAGSHQPRQQHDAGADCDHFHDSSFRTIVRI